jgi:flagellar FliJ protein
VRDLRAHDEDRAKEAFAASLGERVRGAALLAAAAAELDDAVATRRSAGGRSGTDLVAMQVWLERVEHSRREAEQELARREAELAERRTQLTEASRRRQALDRLRERRAAEHAQAASRRESARLDEIGIAAHARKGAA